MVTLLTIKQAAERLGIHQATLRVWADSGKVPMVKLPSGYRRFEPEVIDRLRREWGYKGDEIENDPD